MQDYKGGFTHLQCNTTEIAGDEQEGTEGGEGMKEEKGEWGKNGWRQGWSMGQKRRPAT